MTEVPIAGRPRHVSFLDARAEKPDMRKILNNIELLVEQLLE